MNGPCHDDAQLKPNWPHQRRNAQRIAQKIVIVKNDIFLENFTEIDKTSLMEIQYILSHTYKML